MRGYCLRCRTVAAVLVISDFSQWALCPSCMSELCMSELFGADDGEASPPDEPTQETNRGRFNNGN